MNEQDIAEQAYKNGYEARAEEAKRYKDLYEYHKEQHKKAVLKITRLNKKIEELEKALKEQKIEIEFLFDFYKRTFKKDCDFFLSAFIQKHKIFGQSKGGGEEIGIEEGLKMLKLQEGMCDDSPQKQIEKR